MRLKQIADVVEGAPERVKGAGLGLAQVCLDLGEGLLNRIEIGRISRQEQEPGASLFQTLGSLFTLVDRQVVEDHHVTFVQARRELRLDVSLESQPGDRAINDPQCTQLMAP